MTYNVMCDSYMNCIFVLFLYIVHTNLAVSDITINVHLKIDIVNSFVAKHGYAKITFLKENIPTTSPLPMSF